MSLTTVTPFSTDSYYGFESEEKIIWLEDCNDFAYIRESQYIGPRRRSKPPTPGEKGSRLLGYAVCKKNCKHDEEHQRRVFWIKPYDRDSEQRQPGDSYEPGSTPAEAVDPRTVKAGEESELTDRAIWSPGKQASKSKVVVTLASDIWRERNKRMAAATVQIFKDENNGTSSMVTDATDERDFYQAAASALASIVEDKRFEGDWNFQFENWLVNIVDVACKLRGYKSEVVERRLLVAGKVFPQPHHLVMSSGPGLASVEPLTTETSS